MNLKKMLLLATMAMAAAAFAAPAVAQATVQLTEPAGSALKEGAKVTATSTNLKTTTEQGTLECAKVTIHGEVTNNGPNNVMVKPLGEVTTETCKIPVSPDLALPVTIDKATVGTITVNTTGGGSAAATFVSTIFNEPYPGNHEAEVISHCHFAGQVGFQGTKGTDILHAGPSGLTAMSPTPEPGCAVPGGTIAGEFTLETSNGTEVIIDHS